MAIFTELVAYYARDDRGATRQLAAFPKEGDKAAFIRYLIVDKKAKLDSDWYETPTREIAIEATKKAQSLGADVYDLPIVGR